jgi:hypothetical protein
MRVTDLTSGKVNLDYLSAPLLDRVSALTDNFKVPDKPLGGTVDGRGKTFTQSIRPRNATTTEIPQLPFTSFDPTTGEYVTSWSNAIPIQVQAVETVSASDLIGSNQSAQPKSTPTEVEGGILANYTGDDLLHSEEVAMTPFLVLIIAIPPLSFIVVLAWLAIRKHASLPTALQKNATKQATKTLKTASSLTQDKQAIEISKALRTLKSNPLQNENTVRQMEALLKRCDASQFGGLSDSKLAKDAATLVEQLS